MHGRREVEKKKDAARARNQKPEEAVTDLGGMGTDREQELAATKIQSRVRGKQARHRNLSQCRSRSSLLDWRLSADSK